MAHLSALDMPAVDNQAAVEASQPTSSPRPADKDGAGSSAATKLVSVVIVNFNAGDYLRRAVESVLDQQYPSLEVIVVDNHSTDGSTDWYRQQTQSDPRLQFIPLESNTGFANASNHGIHRAGGRYLLFLNPDCRMFPGTLDALLRAIDADAGMVGPRIVNPDGSEQRGARRDIPTPWQIFCVTLQLHKMMPQHPRFRSFNRHLEPLPDAPEVVPAISGACMLVTRSAVSRVGTMDGEFFLHFEDLDWCMRFNDAKEKILFAPAAVVEHTRGVCSAKRPVRAEYHKHRSLIRFLRKHFTAYYPSSFMALVAVMVSVRFMMLIPRLLWHRATRRATPSSGGMPI